MKKLISLTLLTLLSIVLSSCSFFRVHKIDVQQGNIITEENVSRLHRGMSEAQVKEIMGTPILSNIFTPNRVNYVYTFKPAYGRQSMTRVVCIFVNGRLQEVLTSHT